MTEVTRQSGKKLRTADPTILGKTCENDSWLIAERKKHIQRAYGKLGC